MALDILRLSRRRRTDTTRSYKNGISHTIKTRLSNSYLIGEIFGMLTFGMVIDRLGRRTGIVFATLFLILGIVIATASHGKTELGYASLLLSPLVSVADSDALSLFWMMIVGRGVAGFGAGGE